MRLSELVGEWLAERGVTFLSNNWDNRTRGTRGDYVTFTPMLGDICFCEMCHKDGYTLYIYDDFARVSSQRSWSWEKFYASDPEFLGKLGRILGYED